MSGYFHFCTEALSIGNNFVLCWISIKILCIWIVWCLINTCVNIGSQVLSLQHNNIILSCYDTFQRTCSMFVCLRFSFFIISARWSWLSWINISTVCKEGPALTFHFHCYYVIRYTAWVSVESDSLNWCPVLVCQLKLAERRNSFMDDGSHCVVWGFPLQARLRFQWAKHCCSHWFVDSGMRRVLIHSLKRKLQSDVNQVEFAMFFVLHRGMVFDESNNKERFKWRFVLIFHSENPSSFCFSSMKSSMCFLI